MYSNLVLFDSILESIKDDTGMTNLTNLLPRIRRLVYRTEKDIGFGASLILRKVVYKTSDNTIIYDGYQYKLKLPDDVVHIEKIGICEENKICPGDYRLQGNWMFFSKKQQLESFTLLYYTLLTDGEGNPVVSENHLEAVVSGICYYLYRPKRFVDKGSRATYRDMEIYYHNRIGEARGDDVWPSTPQEWAKISEVLRYSTRDAFMYSSTEQCFKNVPESVLTTGGNPPAFADIHYPEDPTEPGGGGLGDGDGGGGGDIDPTMPEVSINISSQFVERGTSFEETVVITFVQNDAGALISYSLEKDSKEISTTQSTPVNYLILNQFTMQGKAIYEPGIQFPEGTAESELATLTEVLPQWKGQKNNDVSMNNQSYSNLNSVLEKFVQQGSNASITVSAGNYGFFISTSPNAVIKEDNLGFKISPNAYQKNTITVQLANEDTITLTEYIIRPSGAEFTYNIEGISSLSTIQQ